MKKANSHGLWSRVSKLLALTLALVLIVGALPVSAATNEVVVKTKKQLVKAMEKKSSATIIFRTNRKTRFIIPALENSANKKLVMEAPNARAFNKATFKTITLNTSGYFNERGNDNSLFIKSDGVKLTVSKGIEAKKVSITATDVLVKVASDGFVGDIICNKKEADITVAVAKNAEANITIKKKADLNVTGDKSADIKIVAKAKDSKITASAPVEIVAEKDVDVALEKGSEGSSVESAKGVDVDLSGAAEKNATVIEDGKTVQEAVKAEEKEEEKKDTTSGSGSGSSTSANDTSSNTGYTPSTDNTSSNTGTTDNTPATVTYRLGVSDNSEGRGTFTITVDGTEVATGASIEAGKTVVVTLTPNEGYVGRAFVIEEGVQATVNDDSTEFKFSGFNDDFTIVIGFVEKQQPPVITPDPENDSEPVILRASVSVATGGSISISASSGAAIAASSGAIVCSGCSIDFYIDDSETPCLKFELDVNGVVNGCSICESQYNYSKVATLDLLSLSGEINSKLITYENIYRISTYFTGLTEIKLPSNVSPAGLPEGITYTHPSAMRV